MTKNIDFDVIIFVKILHIFIHIKKFLKKIDVTDLFL